jgi:hypothetical protein
LGIPETSSLSFAISCADALAKLSNSPAQTQVSIDDRCMVLLLEAGSIAPHEVGSECELLVALFGHDRVV